MAGKKKAPKEKAQDDKQRPTATLRSTSGAGFEFEDLISAWLQVKMLAGEPMPLIGGAGIQLQAQVSTLGWQIDDLLLTAQAAGGAKRRLAISAKGNLQVSAAGLPADFALRAWAQWRGPESPMNRTDDGLVLITQGVHRVFDPAWREVKNACSGSDADLIISRIRSNKRQSTIFDSIRKPTDTAPEATEQETIELIRHLHVLPVDFQLAYSEFENQAIGQCRQLLASADLDKAKELWRTHVNVATEIRIRRGTITLGELWAVIRQRFQLRVHPDFQQDWETLSNLTADYKARIETELPFGYHVQRSDERAKLEAAIVTNRVTVVFGDSGTGKSALTKSVLDERFADHTQVWFGPDDLKIALSAARRNTLPLRHDLGRVLNASINSSNILVLDSAERIEPTEYTVLRRLIYSLLPSQTEPTEASWRIIIITQPQSGIEGAEVLLGGLTAGLLELEPLTSLDVKNVLSASPALRWLISHDETIAALTNLRTLAWVVRAGSALGSSASSLSSHAAIADRLWAHWTAGSPDAQALIMRLAQREASFERSIALSGLDPVDVTTFTRLPPQAPLRLVLRTNSIEFEHDLAADWARFQFLKQFANDTSKWADFAENPLWTNALRMLGQFLLRQMVGSRIAWDQAFENAESAGLRLVGDILLDAICLDPEAERFMTERAELLLADNAKHLERLLIRFHHIGTLPVGGISGVPSSLNLYLEARYRTVIFWRWPPLLRFLISQRDKIRNLVSSAIAQTIHTWLTRTPKKFSNGTPIPYRHELAEIALEMARTVQVEKGHGVMYLTREPLLYTTPLAAASELPDEVAGWALELAGRRDIATAVTTRIDAVRRQQAKEHAEKLRTNSEYKSRYEKRRQIPPMIGSTRERLPSWPLGANREVDMDFRTACLKEGGLIPLMHVRPDEAAEVLLALIIEDQPYREYGSGHLEIELGLEYAQDGYPTAFWKSPFFQFLQIAPQTSLKALIALVEFCTERWIAEVLGDREGPAPSIAIEMSNGEEKTFGGWSQVFDWTQTNSIRDGNLFSALDALERWLTSLLDSGTDITAHVEQILRDSSSTAFLGLLVNVGKYQPALFTGPLAPLLTNPYLFYWDNERVKYLGSKFVGWSWLQDGETVFDLAKSWILAPHRKQTLLNVSAALLQTNERVAKRLKTVTPSWTVPEDPKEALELKLLVAALDRENYQPVTDPESDKEVLALTYPESLRSEVEQWQGSNAKSMNYLLLPSRCEELLQKQQSVSDENAAEIYELLKSCDADDECEQDVKTKCMLALAAVLVVCGDAWLSKTPEARDYAVSFVKTSIIETGSTANAVRSSRIGRNIDDLKFAAFAAMHLWMKNDGAAAEWEGLALRLLTSGDARSASIVVGIAYAYRERLGSAWWRLLLAGLLWSGLVLLSPRHGDGEHVERAWNVWLAKLRRFPLRRDGATADDLKVGRIAVACERLDYDRRKRDYASGDRRWRGKPVRRSGANLDDHVLGNVFGWLVEGPGTGDWAEDSKLVRRLWTYEATRMQARAKDTGEYDLPTQFSYDTLFKLAHLSLTAPEGVARMVWEPVLSHGPEAHYGVRHFVQSLFVQLSKGADPKKFESVWRETAEYGLAARWEKKDRHWFNAERILCDLLGFGNEDALRRLPSGTALRMRDVYEQWAESHLERDEECVTRFCHFLTSEFGAPIRLDGLRWIATMFKRSKRSQRWYRDGTGEALIELLNTSLIRNTQELATNSDARQPVIEIAADLVARNIPNTLALHERIKLLR